MSINFTSQQLSKNCMSLVAATLLLSLSCPGSGTAQDISLSPLNPVIELGIEELMQIEVPTVFGASKYEQTVTEAPASVTIITADEIRMYGYRNLAETLQSVRSFSITYDRNYHYVGMRGFSRPGDYNTRVLLLVDGIRTNDSVYDQAPVGNDFPLDIDLIERIEIVRGPGHTLYGSNAFFGVINVITKRGQTLNGMELSGEAGSFNSYKGRMSFGRRFGSGLETLLSGSFADSRGQDLYFKEFDTLDQNNGRAIENDGERFGSSFLKLHYKDLTLTGSFLQRRKNVPTASYGTVFNTPLNKTIDTRAFLDMKYEHQFDNNLNILARVTFSSYYYDGSYLFEGVPDRILNIDYSRGNTIGTELQITKELFQKHKVIAGGEARKNIHIDQHNYDAATVYLDDRRSSLSLSLYIQDEFTLLDDLVLHGGIRYDHFDTFDDTFNPRLALVYNPLPDTTLKLLYGRAFRAPNAYEMYYSDGGATTLSNTALKQETNTSYEAILEQAFSRNITATATVFYNQMKGIISQTTLAGGSSLFENLDTYSTRGVEFEVSGKWNNGVQGRASYSFQQARRNGADPAVQNSPSHLAKANLTLPVIASKIFLSLEEQYTGKKKTMSGSDAAGFFVTNLTVFTRNILKGLEFSGSIYNLFDRHYGNPVGSELRQDLIEQDGRTFRLKMSYVF